jgi:hypothetical protein
VGGIMKAEVVATGQFVSLPTWGCPALTDRADDSVRLHQR